MPFKSKAQRRKFAQLLVQGEISPEVFEEWNRETGGAELPERVKKKTPKKRARGRKDSRRVTTKKPARPRRRTAKKRATARR